MPGTLPARSKPWMMIKTIETDRAAELRPKGLAHHNTIEEERRGLSLVQGEAVKGGREGGAAKSASVLTVEELLYIPKYFCT